MGAAGRGRRRVGHRQVERVPHGPPLSARHPRGERRGARCAAGADHRGRAQLHHHHRADGGHAAPSRGGRGAHGGVHLPVRIGCRRRGHGRARAPGARLVRGPSARYGHLRPPVPLQPLQPQQRHRRGRAERGRAQAGGRDPQDLGRPRRPGQRHLRARPGAARAQRVHQPHVPHAHQRGTRTRGAGRRPRHPHRGRPRRQPLPRAARRHRPRRGARGPHPRGPQPAERLRPEPLHLG